MNLRFLQPADWHKDPKKAGSDGCGLLKASVLGIEPLTEKDVVESSAERVLQWKMSDERRDRDGDRMIQNGWDLDHYQKNPVVLFAHDYKSMPIGKSLKTWVGQSTSDGPHLKAVIQFAHKDLNPQGHMAYELAKAGYLSGASVGFIPKEYEPDQLQDGEDEDTTKLGYKISKMQLLENSIVPVPAHPHALVEARSVHGIDISPYIEWAERILDDAKADGILIPRKTVELVRSIASPSQRSFHFVLSGAPTKAALEKAMQETLEKTAVPYRRFMTADPPGEFFSEAEERNAAAIGDLYWMSLLWDPENDKDRGRYRYIHHFASDLRTSWPGVQAAMAAVLSGAVPVADKPFAYQHIAEHYRDFRQDPPLLKEYSAEELRKIFPGIAFDETKGAIPYGKTPLASEDATWDGPAQTAAAEPDVLKLICTWYDSSKPDLKSSYKLPHHMAAGKHSTVWKGVTAAMGALLGARGGVQIPADDKKGVYNHLAKHYKDFGKDAPDFKAYTEAELKAMFPELYEAKDSLAVSRPNPSIDNDPASNKGPGSPDDCISVLNACADFLFKAPEMSDEQAIRLDSAVDLCDSAIDMVMRERGIEDPDDDDEPDRHEESQRRGAEAPIIRIVEDEPETTDDEPRFLVDLEAIKGAGA